MNKLTLIIGLLLIAYFAKELFTNRSQQPVDLGEAEFGLLAEKKLDFKQGECIPLDKIYGQYPEASPEEIYEVEQCHRASAKRLGLDKANTGFLGNTLNPPTGALAHYEGSSGVMSFTVYESYILTGEGSKETRIPFSKVDKIEEGWQMPGSVDIEYFTDRGTRMQYSVMLLREDDLLKAEGARDIDRIISLLKEQKHKAL